MKILAFDLLPPVCSASAAIARLQSAEDVSKSRTGAKRRRASAARSGVARWLEQRRRNLRRRRVAVLGEQVRQIKPAREHGELAVGGARPLLFRPVPVKLDAVVVGIAQIERLADAVIGG